MPLRNNRTYPYKIELRTYLKYCNGAETFYSYDPQRRRLQNLAVNAGGKTIMDSALQLQSIKDNYKTFDLPYNGQDNTDYVNGKGFSSDDGEVMQHIEYVPYGEVFIDELELTQKLNRN